MAPAARKRSGVTLGRPAGPPALSPAMISVGTCTDASAGRVESSGAFSGFS